MPNDIFAFKQFAITQTMSAMKVGTDAVLLGAAADLPDTGNVLDIGTGTGIVAIMAAQRCPDVSVTAIEIDTDAAREACANVAATPWRNRIEVVCGDVRNWDSGGKKHDCIVSNPPYYEGMLRGDDQSRNVARHDETLSLAELMAAASRLLADDGTCTVIVPSETEDNLLRAANDCGLALSGRMDIITREGKSPKRAIIELRRRVGMIWHRRLTIKDKHGHYTADYTALTSEFYKHLK